MYGKWNMNWYNNNWQYRFKITSDQTKVKIIRFVDEGCKRGAYIECNTCKKEKYYQKAQLERGIGVFCGRKCFQKSRTGKAPVPAGKFTPEMKEKMKQAKHRNPTRYWKGKTIPDYARKKMAEARYGVIPWHKGKHVPAFSGKNNHMWKGGVTSKNSKIRGSLEYRQWRNAVFKRDNYTCVWCGDKNQKGRGKSLVLNADHIKPFAYYPELRFELSNGRTLCVPCHRKTDTYGKRNKKYELV